MIPRPEECGPACQALNSRQYRYHELLLGQPETGLSDLDCYREAGYRGGKKAASILRAKPKMQAALEWHRRGIADQVAEWRDKLLQRFTDLFDASIEDFLDIEPREVTRRDLELILEIDKPDEFQAAVRRLQSIRIRPPSEIEKRKRWAITGIEAHPDGTLKKYILVDATKLWAQVRQMLGLDAVQIDGDDLMRRLITALAESADVERLQRLSRRESKPGDILEEVLGEWRKARKAAERVRELEAELEQIRQAQRASLALGDGEGAEAS